ncbi:LysR substrate-binding domain-containing protein [Chitinimonas lacunae]|uniref:LysR substrate-binding domain-containing protein n=1 Tax=Chitinimonas lacunae TaxID=1963018 RepID=A0ABV8MU12_9NEIS
MLISNRLRKIDIQDLLVFKLIYELKSVTDVADRLSVSQSTVSYCLKRLREGFNDELFINSRGGMQATPKALHIRSHVDSMIDNINKCYLGEQTFDHRRDSRSFTICAPEYFEVLILPVLMKTLLDAGSAASITVRKLERDVPFDEISRGEIDLALCFGPSYYRRRPGLSVQPLFHDELVVVRDERPPVEAGPIDIDAFAQAMHVYPTPWVSDSNMVDGWLHKHGRSRVIAARANSYFAALQLIPGTELLLTLPRRIYDVFGPAARTRAQQPPNGFPTFTLDMIWHRQVADDIANSWLREQVMVACRDAKLI